MSCCLTGKNFEFSVESTSPITQAAMNTSLIPQVIYLRIIFISQFFNLFVKIVAIEQLRMWYLLETKERNKVSL